MPRGCITLVSPRSQQTDCPLLSFFNTKNTDLSYFPTFRNLPFQLLCLIPTHPNTPLVAKQLKASQLHKLTRTQPLFYIKPTLKTKARVNASFALAWAWTGVGASPTVFASMQSSAKAKQGQAVRVRRIAATEPQCSKTLTLGLNTKYHCV